MIEQTYLMIESNFVVNVCLWDGNVETWTPPANVTMLVQEETPTKIWELIENEYVLVDSIGNAGIGFSYKDGVCITNKPKPVAPLKIE
jgi:hypothetical protein